MNSFAKCLRCPLGHYCPEATISPIACDGGKFGDVKGLPTSNCSMKCIINIDGSSHLCEDSICKPGYYCPIGSTSATQHECGSSSLYCPAGSAVII